MLQKQNGNSAKPDKTIRIHYHSDVRSIVLSADMQYLAYGRDDDLVFVWRLKPLALIAKVDVTPYQSRESRTIPSLWILSSHNLLRVALGDGATVDFSLHNGEVIKHRAAMGRREVVGVQLCNDGLHIATTTPESVTLSEVSRSMTSLSWRAPVATVSGASFSPRCRLLAVNYVKPGQTTPSVDVLDMRSRQVIGSTPGILLKTSSSDFSQMSDRFLCASLDSKQALLWSSAQHNAFQMVPLGQGSRVNGCFALSPNGRLLASSDQVGFATVWGVDSHGGVQPDLFMLGVRPQVIDIFGAPTCLTFTPNSRALLMGDREGNVRLWQLEKDKTTAFISPT